jgi:two-component system, sensor histidine kinase
LGGHNARAAYAAAAALDLALNFNPHVVFSDIQMPAMHGAEFARRLRQVPGLEDVVVIATSATSRDDPRLEGYDGLFDDWLVKPYGLAELESMLTRFAPRLLRRR